MIVAQATGIASGGAGYESTDQHRERRKEAKRRGRLARFVSRLSYRCDSGIHTLLRLLLRQSRLGCNLARQIAIIVCLEIVATGQEPRDL